MESPTVKSQFFRNIDHSFRLNEKLYTAWTRGAFNPAIAVLIPECFVVLSAFTEKQTLNYV